MGSNEKQLMLGISAALALAMGVVWVVPRLAGTPDAPEVAAEAQPEAVVAAAPEAQASSAQLATEPEPSAEPEPTPEPEPEPEPEVVEATPPSFDHFERQADGEALIAGRADPNQKIDILLAGQVVAQAVSDGAGTFVSFISIPPSDQPRKLSMVADPEGEPVLSAQEIIVAPFALPKAEPAEELVAQADAQEEPLAAPELDTATETDTDIALDANQDVAAVSDDQIEPAVSDVSNAVEEVADAVDVAVEETVDVAVAKVVDPIAPEVPLDAPSDDAQLTEADVVQAEAPNANLTAAEVAKAETVMDTDVVAEAQPDVQAEADADVPQIEETAADVVSVDPVEDPVTEATETAATTSTTVAPEVADTDGAEVAQVTATIAAPSLLSDADGVRIIPPSDVPPEVLSNVALDAITYDPSGEVLLSGRASGGGFVQVYVDNQPITTSRISVDGAWRTDLPEVDTGIYTLRIDEVDESGTVVSRVETPFKREEPEAVAAVLAEETAQEGFEVAVRTVQPGSTLWAIAREQFGEGIMYVEVFEANRDLIRDPDLIFPGQVFRMPEMTETTGQ